MYLIPVRYKLLLCPPLAASLYRRSICLQLCKIEDYAIHWARLSNSWICIFWWECELQAASRRACRRLSTNICMYVHTIHTQYTNTPLTHTIHRQYLKTIANRNLPAVPLQCCLTNMYYDCEYNNNNNNSSNESESERNSDEEEARERERLKERARLKEREKLKESARQLSASEREKIVNINWKQRMWH